MQMAWCLGGARAPLVRRQGWVVRTKFLEHHSLLRLSPPVLGALTRANHLMIAH